MNGISSVTDSPRPGQAHREVTTEAIAAVEATVKENRLVKVNEIAAHLDISHGSAQHNVHDTCKKFKVFKVFIWLTLVKPKIRYRNGESLTNYTTSHPRGP